MFVNRSLILNLFRYPLLTDLLFLNKESLGNILHALHFDHFIQFFIRQFLRTFNKLLKYKVASKKDKTASDSIVHRFE